MIITATMTLATREMIIASQGVGAGTGAGAGGGAGAVGAGYATAGAVIDGTVAVITTGLTGADFTVNVPVSPLTSTL